MISCITFPVCFPDLSVTAAGQHEIEEMSGRRKSIVRPVKSMLLTELKETVGIALSSLFTKCNLLLFTQKLSVLFHNLIAFHVIFHELI